MNRNKHPKTSEPTYRHARMEDELACYTPAIPADYPLVPPEVVETRDGQLVLFQDVREDGGGPREKEVTDAGTA